MDQIERALTDLHAQALQTWKHHNCLECPMGEMAALVSALLIFYQLNTGARPGALAPRPSDPLSTDPHPSPHWSHGWRKTWGG